MKRNLQKGFIFLLLILVICLGIWQGESDNTGQKYFSVNQLVSSKKQNWNKRKNRIAQTKGTIVKDKRIDRYLKKNHFSGSAFVENKGRTLLLKGYGQANRREININGPDTLYLVGSLEKAFVAVAVMLLYEQRRLDINAPLSKYFPSFPNGEKIKICNLLTHTSGIVGLGAPRPKTYFNETPSALLARISQNGISRQPGTWNYSDANYIILGSLIEKITHHPLQQYLQFKVMSPVGIKDAGFASNDFYRLPHAATGYCTNGRTISILPDMNLLFGAGNLYVSVRDMAAFDSDLLGDKLLSQHSLDLMFTPRTKASYGFGYYIYPNKIVDHGYVGAYSSTNAFQKNVNKKVILFSNKLSGSRPNTVQLGNTIYQDLLTANFAK